MLDILPADVLVLGSKEYPVVKPAIFAINTPGSGLRLGLIRQLVNTASTKRAGTSGGLRTAPTTYLSNLKAGNLDPLTGEQITTEGLKTPGEYREIYVMDSESYARLIVEVLKA